MKIKNKPMLIVGLISWALGAALLMFALSMCTMEPDTQYITLPPIDEPVPPELGDVQYIIYDGSEISFVYESETRVFASGTAAYAGPGIISVGDVLYYLDSAGNILQSYRLPCVADFIAINGPDVWSGRLEGEATRIYKNLLEIGLYDWTLISLNVTHTGDVVAFASPGYGYIFESLTGSEEDITYASDGGLFIFDLNTTDKTATFRGLYDYTDGWSTNYFWRATGWLLADGLWISSNGYSWDAGGLYENSTAMWTWNSYPYPVQDIYNELPSVIPAAVRAEHSEDVTYWIECNTGYLIRYTPSLDLIEPVIRLYAGDGLRSSGYALQYSLNPSQIGEALYYHYNGFLYEYDFTTGTASNMGTDILIWGIE